MEGRFARSRIGAIVQGGSGTEVLVDLGDDRVGGDPLLPVRGEGGGRTAFAVHAVVCAGLEGDQVDAETDAQSAGRDRSEQMLEGHDINMEKPVSPVLQ